MQTAKLVLRSYILWGYPILLDLLGSFQSCRSRPAHGLCAVPRSSRDIYTSRCISVASTGLRSLYSRARPLLRFRVIVVVYVRTLNCYRAISCAIQRHGIGVQYISVLVLYVMKSKLQFDGGIKAGVRLCNLYNPERKIEVAALTSTRSFYPNISPGDLGMSDFA